MRLVWEEKPVLQDRLGLLERQAVPGTPDQRDLMALQVLWEQPAYLDQEQELG